MKNEKGITLISLILTVVLMFIVTATTVYNSTNRFKINNMNKMINDIELLNDKISSYYLKYGGMPLLKDEAGKPIEYTYTEVDFEKDTYQNYQYYIIDLEAIGNMTLNYGEEGYKNPNMSDDVYVISKKTYTIYYVKGIEYADGKIYHVAEKRDTGNLIKPTTPKINVISGTQDKSNSNTTPTNLYFTSDVTLEFVPGRNNANGVSSTTYSINNGPETNILSLTNNEYILTTNGSYEIRLRSYTSTTIYSETILTVNITK